jgi:hypothetical protein
MAPHAHDGARRAGIRVLPASVRLKVSDARNRTALRAARVWRASHAMCGFLGDDLPASTDVCLAISFTRCEAVFSSAECADWVKQRWRV